MTEVEMKYPVGTRFNRMYPPGCSIVVREHTPQIAEAGIEYVDTLIENEWDDGYVIPDSKMIVNLPYLDMLAEQVKPMIPGTV